MSAPPERLTVTLNTGKTEHVPVHDAQHQLEELTERGTVNGQAWIYLRENEAIRVDAIVHARASASRR